MIFGRDEGRVSCATCEYARSRHADAAAAASAAAAGTSIPELHCLEGPIPVAKRPDEACARHSELRMRDRLDLADMIALAIVKQQRETR